MGYISETEISNLTIAELGKLIASRELSPVEVTEASLRRISCLNPIFNAFITVASERARAEAKAAEDDLSAGNYRGPLHGIPIGIKDIIDSKGVLTTHGSSFFRENTPKADAECVKRLRTGGAIIIGKCNTAEFAAESCTNNPHFGACRNPWDKNRVPAGSSGGSAAAVAARMVPGALGTDTGGSVRGPAAICGTVGLKPTYGRISVNGVFPNATSLDHVGPLTRTVRDSAILLQGMAGFDKTDPFCIDMPVPDFCAKLELGINGAKLAVCPDLIDVEIDGPILDAFAKSLDVLRNLGATIETISCEFADEINPSRRAIADAEFFYVHGERFAKNPNKYGERLRERILNAKNTTLKMYINALERRRVLSRRMADLLSGYSALLAPGYPCLAAPLDTEVANVNGKNVDFVGLGRNLVGLQNFIGFPGLTLPTGYDAEFGLPMGIQITTLPGEEAEGFRVGHAYEEATPELRNGILPIDR